MNPLISKARKPKFELHLRIFDLNNVPLVSGTSYVKWHLPSSTAAEHRGRTHRAPIQNHKVTWDYSKSLPIRLFIDKSTALQECLINFEIIQDYSSSLKSEKITLGNLSLNLSEYVEEGGEIGAEGEEGVVRRYLMQDSKINSTVKIGIWMVQVDGDRNFVAPPLRSAPVFGGIAGIMGGETVEQDDPGHMPMMNKSRDHGEQQDMYRRALAASWAAHPLELPADQCVEDIFTGGDGWKHDTKAPQITGHDDGLSESNGHRRGHSHHHHRRTPSGTSTTSQNSQNTVTGARSIVSKFSHKHSKSQETMNVSPIGQQDTSSENSSDRGREMGFRRPPEIDELDAREDLVAWRLPVQAPEVAFS